MRRDSQNNLTGRDFALEGLQSEKDYWIKVDWKEGLRKFGILPNKISHCVLYSVFKVFE